MDHVPPAPYRQNGTVYDAIGNPTSYHNGSAYTFSWSEGRKLTSGTKGNTSFGYTYNADGLRTKKTVNGVDYDYYWNGTRLEAMTVTQGQNTEKLSASRYQTIYKTDCIQLFSEEKIEKRAGLHYRLHIYHRYSRQNFVGFADTIAQR